MRFGQNSSMHLFRWSRRLAKQYGTAARARKCQTVASINYGDYLASRLEDAQRSVVVACQSERQFAPVCAQFGAFGRIVHAEHFITNQSNYFFLEFDCSEAATEVKNFCRPNSRSPFLQPKKCNTTLNSKSQDIKLASVNGTRLLGEKELYKILCKAEDLDQQIALLHEQTRINELSTRLRFLCMLQLQQAPAAIFPFARVLPFGSSVNGFGKMGSDLDLVMVLEPELRRNADSNDWPLLFQGKDRRQSAKQQLKAFIGVLKWSEDLTDMHHLRPILSARVPIIKFHHHPLDLEVDLSMSNISGTYMSELMYIFGELDARVRPLTFAIRQWADAAKLIKAYPDSISNFTLSCLIIYFLQTLKQPILPTIRQLEAHATADDDRGTGDGVLCKFACDLQRIEFKSNNQAPLGNLLQEFFQFYADFNFGENVIFLNQAIEVEKPDPAPLYIVNPLEPTLNVAKIVSPRELRRVQNAIRNAAATLNEKCGTKYARQLWGLPKFYQLTQQKTNQLTSPSLASSPRMLEVSAIFEETRKKRR